MVAKIIATRPPHAKYVDRKTSESNFRASQLYNAVRFVFCAMSLQVLTLSTTELRLHPLKIQKTSTGQTVLRLKRYSPRIRLKISII